jgi:aliphatic sulfonates family ABC transporter substrate-binding protein
MEDDGPVKRKDKSANANAPRRNVLAGLLSSGAVLAMPAMLTPRLAHAQSNPTLRLGYQFHLWGAPAVVGLKRDFFAAEGVKVESKRFASGTDARNAMIAGSVDVATIGMTPFVLGTSLGNMVGVATVCYAGRTGAVMAKANSGITKVADLKGKKIASQVGSTLDNVFKKRIASEAGLQAGDYSIVNVQFSDQVAALAAGSVDAFLGLEPFCAIAEYRKLAVQLTDYYKYDTIPNMLAVTTDFATKHPETLIAFLRGWLKAVALFKQNPAEVNKIMLSVYKESGYDVPPEVVQRVIDRLVVTPEFLPELLPSMRQEAESLLAAGRIKSIPDPGKALDTQYLKAAGYKS